MNISNDEVIRAVQIAAEAMQKAMNEGIDLTLLNSSLDMLVRGHKLVEAESNNHD